MGLPASVITTLLLLPALYGDVRLPALISDHMMLQRGVPVRIWGWAAPGESVSVSFHGQTAISKADDQGSWQLYLKPMPQSPPSDMKIQGASIIYVRDVLVGDVWLASGQSNMEYGMARLHNIPAVQNSEPEIARANYPDIRFFLAQERVSEQPLDDLRGRWQRCSPDSVRPFSAVAYFFARELFLTQHVPIGVIGSYWGGSPAHSWLSSPALRSDPGFQFIFDDWQKTLDRYPSALPKYQQDLAAWEMKPTERPPQSPDGPNSFRSPAGLFNGMIAPITPFAIRGIIWYQGESDANARMAYAYRRLFPALIEDWRTAWGLGPLPFFFVQISSYIEKGWRPLLRESQTQALDLRNTAMAVTIDIGNPTYNHPADKQDVGHRLALPARAMVYGEKIVYSGPLFREMTTEGSNARLWFDHAAGGLAIHGQGPLHGFELAGPDGIYAPAAARIDGETVLVSSDSVPRPSTVRYAWSDNPVDANLVNRENLPASPFRSRPSGEK